MKQIILNLSQPQIEIELFEDTEILGIFIGKNDDMINTKINIIHNLPHIKSNTLVKAVLFDRSKVQIDCNLIINKGAKQTDGYFKIDTLILSKQAGAKIIPGLEIMENDVKGGHGATVGKVNRDQFKYLLSRGLSPQDAENLIVEGYLNDIINQIQDENIKLDYLKQIQ